MMKGNHYLVWNALKDKHIASDITRIANHSKLSSTVVLDVINRFKNAGLIKPSVEGLCYKIQDIWVDYNLYDAKPRMLPSRDWGVEIILPNDASEVKPGDLVIVTTAKGITFEPALINAVNKQWDKHSLRHYLCSSIALPKINQFNEDIPAPPPLEPVVPELDMSQIQTLVEDLVAKRVAEAVKPMVIEVRVPEQPAVKLEGTHYLFPRLLRLVNAGFNVFMWGPPGTGKTTAAMQVAEALSRTAEIDTLDPTTARSMIQGYMNPMGQPVHNSFTRCWEQGQIYIADEVDLAPGHVQTLFNSALANGYAPLAWGNVKRSDNFGFIATGNTAGRPTAAFPDRRPMSNAFADRLYFMHWPMDPAIECRVGGLPIPVTPASPEVKECTPYNWVTFVQALRKWAESNAPTLSITPRASLLGIKALAIGETPDNVADGLIFRGCDSDLRAKALRNVRWQHEN